MDTSGEAYRSSLPLTQRSDAYDAIVTIKLKLVTGSSCNKDNNEVPVICWHVPALVSVTRVGDLEVYSG